MAIFGIELLNFRGCTKLLLLGLLRNTLHFNKRAMEDVHCQSSKAPLSIAIFREIHYVHTCGDFVLQRQMLDIDFI